VNPRHPEHAAAPFLSGEHLRSLLRQARPASAVCVALGLLAASLPATVRQPPALVAAYDFNEGSGSTLRDASGNNNHGTLTNGPVWTRSGKFGGALTFDGRNDLVSINDSPSLNLRTGMTLEAWVNPGGAFDAGPILLKGGRESVASFKHLHPKLKPQERTVLSYALFTAPLRRNSGALVGVGHKIYSVTSPAGLWTTSWRHVAATYDGSAARLYVNGKQVDSRAVRGDIRASSGPLTIAGSGIWGEYFKGAIDEVRIYRGVLTQTEIKKDMVTPVSPVIAPDTVAPAVSMTAPADHSTLAGPVTLAAQASDDIGVVSVQFLADGSALGVPDAVAPYSVTLDTTTLAEGIHSLAARAVDAAGNTTTSAALTVTVGNAPRLVITQPENASTASGPGVHVSYATLGDLTSVHHVHFVLDGTRDVVDTTFDGSQLLVNVPPGGHVLNGFLERADHSKIAGSDAAAVAFTTTSPDTADPVLLGRLNDHDVRGDAATSRIISWLTPQDAAYDQAIATAWDFMLNRVPDDENGLKAYFTNSYLFNGSLLPSGWMNNPAHMNAALIESALTSYAYSALAGRLPPRARPDPRGRVVGAGAVRVRLRKLPRVRRRWHVRFRRPYRDRQGRRARHEPGPSVSGDG
jgi:hypothetical protein